MEQDSYANEGGQATVVWWQHSRGRSGDAVISTVAGQHLDSEDGKAFTPDMLRGMSVLYVMENHFLLS